MDKVSYDNNNDPGYITGVHQSRCVSSSGMAQTQRLPVAEKSLNIRSIYSVSLSLSFSPFPLVSVFVSVSVSVSAYIVVACAIFTARQGCRIESLRIHFKNSRS